MENLPYSATSRQSSRGIGSIGSTVWNAGKFSVDKRDPKTLGEELLALKKRYGYKKLSTAYDRRIGGQR